MENNQTKEKLLAEIERLKKELKKKKKYGLVWEDKPEDVVEMCKEKLPVLKEVKGKEIITDKNKPVNLLIEGDNYHALSVLNYTHKGKIDVIYIDPPYNTGNKDFKYNDKFVEKEDGFRHSKWLSFIDKRLKLARHLLKDSGILVISIDDNEVFQLKMLLDKDFGENNFIACLPTIMNLKGNQDEFAFAGTHEYTLVWAKNKSKSRFLHFLVNEEDLEDWQEDEFGFFKQGTLKGGGVNGDRSKRPNLYFPIFVNKKGNFYTTENDHSLNSNDFVIYPISDGKEMTWRWSKDKLKKEPQNILVTKTINGYTLERKIRPQLGDLPTKKPKTIFYKPEYSSGNGTYLLKQIFGENRVFNNPKPLELIIDFLKITLNKDSTVLDFMAGSGTTGHAVLELNKEDSGKRQFILCTNNENNIATEVCYPRVKNVIEGYKNSKSENVAGLGGNLKYFKTDFVDYKESTDRNKIKLTKEAVEMLCVKEGTFESVLNNEDFKIFKNHNHYTGIIFEQLAIEDFKKEIKGIKDKISVYIFSLGDDSFEDEFEDIKQKVKLSPIPEAILKVYRRIYK